MYKHYVWVGLKLNMHVALNIKQHHMIKIVMIITRDLSLKTTLNACIKRELIILKTFISNIGSSDN